MTLDAQFGRDLIANLSSSRFLAGSAASINSQVGFATNFGCGFMAEGLTTDCFVPSIDPAGYINGGSTISYHNPLTDMYQWNADFMKVLGHHLLQTGFLFQRNTFFLESGNNSAGFDASQTSDPEIPGTGNALASAFIGVPENSLKTSGLEPIHGLKSFAFYGQDQWKALPNLTFNVGVRYALTAWPIYGLKSNLSDAVGTIDFNNGTYILQTAVGSCAQLGVPPCISRGPGLPDKRRYLSQRPPLAKCGRQCTAEAGVRVANIPRGCHPWRRGVVFRPMGRRFTAQSGHGRRLACSRVHAEFQSEYAYVCPHSDRYEPAKRCDYVPRSNSF
jgi:hypothetical protein